MVLYFNVKIPVTEDLLIQKGLFPGGVVVVAQQVRGDVPRQASRKGDQPLAVGAQELVVNAGLP